MTSPSRTVYSEEGEGIWGRMAGPERQIWRCLQYLRPLILRDLGSNCSYFLCHPHHLSFSFLFNKWMVSCGLGEEKKRKHPTGKKKVKGNVKITIKIWTEIPEFMGGKGPRTERYAACAKMKPRKAGSRAKWSHKDLCVEEGEGLSIQVLARAPFGDTAATVRLQILSNSANSPSPQKKALFSEVTATPAERWGLITGIPASRNQDPTYYSWKCIKYVAFCFLLLLKLCKSLTKSKKWEKIQINSLINNILNTKDHLKQCSNWNRDL